MALLPSESQQPDGRLSLVWTMVYALAAAFAFGFFNDVVVGRWHPELNEGAQVPRPRESVRRPLALFLYVKVSGKDGPRCFVALHAGNLYLKAARRQTQPLLVGAERAGIYYGIAGIPGSLRGLRHRVLLFTGHSGAGGSGVCPDWV